MVRPVDSTLDFGQRLLSLLDTGSFTTSYKYATLLALIDEVLANVGDDGQAPTSVHGRAVGRRVLALYWPHGRAFSAKGPLRQSNVTGDLVSKIAAVRLALGVPEHLSLDRARLRHPADIRSLERTVEETVLRYPIPLLQRFGAGKSAREDRFIYGYGWAPEKLPDDDRLFLVDRAGEALAALAGLLRPVVQREWLHFVARRNSEEIDEFRVERFLFGADRTSLLAVRGPLLEEQQGRCFYCHGTGGPWEVDHFLPWARWPDDNLDNLVAAHSSCNNDKRAALAGTVHLRRWWPRLQPDTSAFNTVQQIATSVGWPRTPSATAGGARALYLHQPPGTMAWASRGTVEPLDLVEVRRTLSAATSAEQAAEDGANYSD